jgi:hypothetical protein
MPRHEILKIGHGVVVMVANHAVNSPATDNYGQRVPFSVTVGVHALGSFSSASQLVIDKDATAANGPTPRTAAPTAKITIDLNGFSVGIVTLRPKRDKARRSRVTKKR